MMDISGLIAIMADNVKNFEATLIDRMHKQGVTAFMVLIATLLSLRTKDEVTDKAVERLFNRADDVHSLVKVPVPEIEKLIYPVGFYRRKAENIIKISEMILEKYAGLVPETIEELLELPGVGRKTANLVISLGFNGDAICVDIHVHRICNRLGLMKTADPYETEMELREIAPKKIWHDINKVFVVFGQNICRPVSPFCSKCPVVEHCSKVGVEKHR